MRFIYIDNILLEINNSLKVVIVAILLPLFFILLRYFLLNKCSFINSPTIYILSKPPA
jgi:hypothetical protein